MIRTLFSSYPKLSLSLNNFIEYWIQSNIKPNDERHVHLIVYISLSSSSDQLLIHFSDPIPSFSIQLLRPLPLHSILYHTLPLSFCGGSGELFSSTSSNLRELQLF
ncbi:hypothetical protein L6452_42366 [Arctium lappa]|uniref:Uncharacterized protein n=1 Tax=Arctium lappa TaxID=4217 RepID=A0ACB8XI25_ARCLA|nr:hypothetical protein L6452_42366 [Arctium lappa]